MRQTLLTGAVILILAAGLISCASETQSDRKGASANKVSSPEFIAEMRAKMEQAKKRQAAFEKEAWKKCEADAESIRDAFLLTMPQQRFPNKALEQGISGEYEAEFDIGIDGIPFNIEPNCSHEVFAEEARKSVSRAKFCPAKENGEVIVHKGFVFPMEYEVRG